MVKNDVTSGLILRDGNLSDRNLDGIPTNPLFGGGWVPVFF